MKTQSDYNEKRFLELNNRAEKSCKYVYTDFLSPSETSILLSLNLNNVMLFGGSEGCERQIARFGNAESIGYELPFPISCIRVDLPKSGPLPELTHRDYLGSLMGLGIERSTIGDIICCENCAYIFTTEKISEYIISELNTVGKFSVHCEQSELPENTVLYEVQHKEINIASYRADCIISAVYNMSRTKSEAVFMADQVFKNGKICKKSDMLETGDTVSVRHKGKFRITEECGYSKKGRLFIGIDIYK